MPKNLCPLTVIAMPPYGHLATTHFKMFIKASGNFYRLVGKTQARRLQSVKSVVVSRKVEGTWVSKT